MGLDELGVIPPALVGTVELDRFLELLPLELDNWVALDTITMVLGQESLGLGIAAVGQEPTRRLWKQENGEDDNASWDALQGERKTPRQVVSDLGRSEGDCGSGDASTEPTAVVEGCETSSPLRRGNLDGIGRRSACL